MDMIDPVREFADEKFWDHPLPDQMTGIKIQSESGSVFKHIKQLLSGIKVKSDFSGMDF
jgi:hypothetical protein